MLARFENTGSKSSGILIWTSSIFGTISLAFIFYALLNIVTELTSYVFVRAQAEIKALSNYLISVEVNRSHRLSTSLPTNSFSSFKQSL